MIREDKLEIMFTLDENVFKGTGSRGNLVLLFQEGTLMVRQKADTKCGASLHWTLIVIG